MLDQEPTKKGEIDIQQLRKNIKEMYPQLILGPRLTLSNLRKNNITGYEECFARMLLEPQRESLVVFCKPKLLCSSREADFFVCNTDSTTSLGKLVEITLYRRDSSSERKKNQVEEFSECGVPFVVLFQEELANVRGRVCPNLYRDEDLPQSPII